MRTYTETIGAGQTLRVNAAGTFFRLLQTTAAVDVRFMRSSAEFASATGMEAGYAEETEQAFDSLEITSATAQTVKFAIRAGGNMRYDRMAGIVDINNVGGDFTNTEKTVTNADGQMLAANAARRYLLIQNKDAAGTIHVKFGAGAATAANGVRIGPGGSYELQGYVARNEVRAIGDLASNANIVTVEG